MEEKITVKVAALSEIRKIVGWGAKEVEFPGGTVAELLKSIPTEDGRNLYQQLVESGYYKNKYIILLNGLRVSCEDGLNKKLASGDKVITMELIRFVAGG
ncbi:MAG: MoaD/ThiS family protein [Clostridia bacterium]|jgi:sulfur carrier protein ThiS|nr:MoaD/ThiS family protein [Clostridia bacterium]